MSFRGGYTVVRNTEDVSCCLLLDTVLSISRYVKLATGML